MSSLPALGCRGRRVTEDSQGVTVFDEIWDAINTELVINIFDLNLSVDEATQIACEAVEAQLDAQSGS